MQPRWRISHLPAHQVARNTGSLPQGSSPAELSFSSSANILQTVKRVRHDQRAILISADGSGDTFTVRTWSHPRFDCSFNLLLHYCPPLQPRPTPLIMALNWMDPGPEERAATAEFVQSEEARELRPAFAAASVYDADSGQFVSTESMSRK